MRLTAQEEYGLRCLLQIAREPAGFATITEVARREGLSVAYVAKLMRVLRKAGLIESIRGQKGGYQLARSPEDLTVAGVLAALGGRMYSSYFCGRYPGRKRACVHDLDCSIRSFWIAVDQVIQQALGQARLKDLLCSQQAMEDWLRTHVQSRPPGAPWVAPGPP